MKLRLTQSAAIVSTLFMSALTIGSPVLAKQPTVSRQTAPKTRSLARKHHPADSFRATAGTAAGAAAGAAGLIGLIASGGTHSGQGVSGADPGAPVVLSAPVAAAPSNAVTIISSASHVDQNRVRSYVTSQPPALVVTAALHRRMTTTSADIPTPTSNAVALLQVRRVDRIINQTMPDVTQAILPAHAVDRGLGFGNQVNTPNGAPEPAPGIILLAGVLSIGALVFARKQRLTSL